ncbi:hypothetical protein BJ742DRAFT_737704 [Cladochytrium replicatum]|nr:hypothetical protein BJ742DRAFT_737704 [Cladochytrium replicatum]
MSGWKWDGKERRREDGARDCKGDVERPSGLIELYVPFDDQMIHNWISKDRELSIDLRIYEQRKDTLQIPEECPVLCQDVLDMLNYPLYCLAFLKARQLVRVRMPDASANANTANEASKLSLLDYEEEYVNECKVVMSMLSSFVFFCVWIILELFSASNVGNGGLPYRSCRVYKSLEEMNSASLYAFIYTNHYHGLERVPLYWTGSDENLIKSIGQPGHAFNTLLAAFDLHYKVKTERVNQGVRFILEANMQSS